MCATSGPSRGVCFRRNVRKGGARDGRTRRLRPLGLEFQGVAMQHARLSRFALLLFALVGALLVVRTAGTRITEEKNHKGMHEKDGRELQSKGARTLHSPCAAPSADLERKGASRCVLPPLPILASPTGDGTFVLKDRSAQATFTDRGVILSLIRPGNSQGWGLRWGLAELPPN